MDAEGIKQSDISQREKKKKDKYCMIVTYMWSFIKKSKRNKNRLTETKNKLTIARRVTR